MNKYFLNTINESVLWLSALGISIACAASFVFYYMWGVRLISLKYITKVFVGYFLGELLVSFAIGKFNTDWSLINYVFLQVV